jgi:hypothetical protein
MAARRKIFGAEPMGKLSVLPTPHEEVEERLTTLYAAWKVYGQLFKTDGRVNLMNSLVPSMAWLLQWVLSDTVILGVCRLCEQGKPITLPALVKSLKTLATPVEHRGLTDRLADITKAVEPLKQHRDKRIAHNTQRFAQKPDEALPPVTRNQIQDAIDQTVGLMNRISELFLDHETHYVPDMTGDGDGLIHWLQYGERLMELQDDSWCNRLNDQQVIEKLRIRMLGEPK